MKTRTRKREIEITVNFLRQKVKHVEEKISKLLDEYSKLKAEEEEKFGEFNDWEDEVK